MTTPKSALLVRILSLTTVAVSLLAAGEQPIPDLGSHINVDPKLVEQLRDDETTGYAIFMRDRPDLSAARDMEWQERGRWVVSQLRRAADQSQRDVVDYLARTGTDYRSFWVDNVIIVESSNLETFRGLEQFREITAVRADPDMHLTEPEAQDRSSRNADADIEPNIAKLRAPQVWNQGFRGQDIVVGTIDSGVRYTHDALARQYRGYRGEGNPDHHHNWWDPAINLPAPLDDFGHGTHVTGIVLGDDGGTNRIGMAPDASWIACRGCPGGSCPASALLECAEFMLAPWDLERNDPDPDLRPHIVNNSWGNCQFAYNDYFQGAVDSWQAAGMVPVFANGNAGNCGLPEDPPCGSVGNPARYGNVLGVGSTGTSNGSYAPHSNKGPTDAPADLAPFGFAEVKPNVAAPGVAIRSATSLGDAGYAQQTGTSMAAPHVSGAIALLWQAAPCLTGDYAGTLEILTAHAEASPHPTQCGGEGPGNSPNQATGWGEINAEAIVEAGRATCQATGPAVHASRIDFGDVVLGDSVGPLMVMVRSIGDQPLEIDAIADPAPPFVATGGSCPEPPTTLDPGDSCTLHYSFTPTELGPAEGHAEIFHNGDVEPFQVALSGNGSATLRFDPEAIAVAPTDVGHTTLPRTVVLENLDSLAATGLSFSTPGGGFEVDAADCGETLPAGATCELMITFSPAGPGAVETGLAVTAHQYSATAELPLSGYGVGEDQPSLALASRAEGPAGAKGDEPSWGPVSVSADGSRIAFASTSKTLHPDANDNVQDIFVRDLLTHETILVSRADGVDGDKGNSFSQTPSISADGRFVAFASSASNLHPDATSGQQQVYLRDLQTNQTLLIGRETGADGAPLGGSGPNLSADGRYVAFTAGDFAMEQVYVRDLETHETVLASRASGEQGDPANANCSGGHLSADGRFVAFTSQADNLHPDDATDTNNDVFVRDLDSHQTFLVSRANGEDGDKGDANSFWERISADGRHVAFQSAARNLDPAAADAQADIFVRNLETFETTLVSRASGSDSPSASAHAEQLSMSADARFIAFHSAAENLHPDADDPVADIFVRDTLMDETLLLSRAGGEDGDKGNFNSFQATVSPDGSRVAFISQATNLHPDKGDTLPDVLIRDLVPSIAPEGELVVAPAPLLFPSLPIGDAATLTTTLFSTGDAGVNVTGLAGVEPPFAISGGNCDSVPFELQPSQNCTLKITFAPESEGSYSDQLGILSDAVGAPHVVNLSGAVAPESSLELDPQSLSFIDVPIGTTSDVRSSSLINNSDSDLTGLSVSPHPAFDVDLDDCGDTLPAGESCQIDVTFAPQAPGVLTVDFWINHGSGSIILTASGNGVEPGDLIYTDRFEAQP